VAELTQLTAQLQSDNAGLKASLQAAQSKCSNYEQLLGRADQSITSLKADVARLEAAVEDLQVRAEGCRCPPPPARRGTGAGS
jgi:multidrug resistance efflux pump